MKLVKLTRVALKSKDTDTAYIHPDRISLMYQVNMFQPVDAVSGAVELVELTLIFVGQTSLYVKEKAADIAAIVDEAIRYK